MSRYSRWARLATDWAGSPLALGLAFALIIGWAVSGPLFAFSSNWQLAINTATTIVTFLMVFVIQHATNRDSRATHKKLDELIRSIDKADNRLRGAERDE